MLREGHQVCRASGKPGILLLGEKAGMRESVNTIFGEQEKVSFDARPHPDLLPRGEGTASAFAVYFKRLSRIQRVVFQRRCERFSFSWGRRPG
jgi:hypothetical protein